MNIARLLDAVSGLPPTIQARPVGRDSLPLPGPAHLRPPTDTCIPQNNHSTSNTISFLAVSDLLRLFPAVSGHILTFSRALEQSDAGVTAEYGPARAQKNQTGKWYPQIPVDHTTPQINQRVVNTTLIPVKFQHCVVSRLLGIFSVRRAKPNRERKQRVHSLADIP